MMVEGNIALIPDESSLRSFMGGLPAFFLGEMSDIWFLRKESYILFQN